MLHLVHHVGVGVALVFLRMDHLTGEDLGDGEGEVEHLVSFLFIDIGYHRPWMVSTGIFDKKISLQLIRTEPAVYPYTMMDQSGWSDFDRLVTANSHIESVVFRGFSTTSQPNKRFKFLIWYTAPASLKEVNQTVESPGLELG